MRRGFLSFDFRTGGLAGAKEQQSEQWGFIVIAVSDDPLYGVTASDLREQADVSAERGRCAEMGKRGVKEVNRGWRQRERR